MRIFPLESALIAGSPNYFSAHSTDARAALLIIRDVSGSIAQLLESGHSTIAGRLAGAFRSCGRDRIADDIAKTMAAAGYDVRESDPFTDKAAFPLPAREPSPYVNRIRLLWQKMREPVTGGFPKAPGLARDINAYLKRVDEVYVTDAYHSLPIEGYRVSPELIERVRSGAWNPEANEEDRQQRNAMAACGYWQVYQAVRQSVGRVLIPVWLGMKIMGHDREMFAPRIAANLLNATDLAGYRSGQVYIRGSMHVPLNREAVRDAMPAFFDLLRAETDPAVRVVLGHFKFVYIHPSVDGNGRMGRFLMNLMLASGGYPWTAIPV